MTDTGSGEPDRVGALERRVDRLDARHDGLVVVAVVLSAVAIVAAIVGIGFGARAIDESKKKVHAADAATIAAAAPASCRSAGGFAAGAPLQDKGTKPAAGSTTAIDAGDFFFSPTCTGATPAGTVTLTVHNAGQALHNVSIPDQNIDQDVDPGQTITVQVKVGSSPVQYFCKYHRTSGMVGALLPAGT